jgi:formaldehyde-activating enzyme
MAQKFDKILIGEALAGEGPGVAHIGLVIGAKGSPVEQAVVGSLAMPREDTPAFRQSSPVTIR